MPGRIVWQGLAGFLGGATLGFVLLWAGMLVAEGVFGMRPAPGPDDHSAMTLIPVSMAIGGVAGALWLIRLARQGRGGVAAIVLALIGLPALAYAVMVIAGA